jgi:hypothetical protein
MPAHTEQKSDGKELSGRKKELVMQIGEPLRTIVVEPLRTIVVEPLRTSSWNHLSFR